MPDEPASPASEYEHHDSTAGSAADRSAKVAVPDTFPASDPVATTASVGSRAVDPAEMMGASDKLDVPDATNLTARFPDHVTAKLAAEKLVRDIPLDRRSIVFSEEGAGATLQITAARSDMERVAEMLDRSGAQNS
jgi:hypothetical protein